MTTVVFAVGARPNFVKMAPVIEATRRRGSSVRSWCTPASTTTSVSSAEIIDDLGFPKPDRFLGIGFGSHGEQTGFTSSPSSACSSMTRPSSWSSGDVNATPRVRSRRRSRASR